MWYSLTLAIGVTLLIISLVIFKNSLQFLSNSERTIATVISLERINDSDGDTYKPVFKYRTKFNQELTYRSTSSSNPPAWKIGEEAKIAYDPADPTSAKILTYFGAFSWTIVLMAIAMPMIVVGGGYHLSHYFLK